ncbi:electron transfer flavoprotein subunit beta/FixA family protein [Acidothermaceae bacterium B102]|nr:electron transfer flavoprotein subunit beta/FixA family protein [Acidothermaceae bacterium B102]
MLPRKGLFVRIVVLIKHVPDAGADRRFAADHTADRAASAGRLSELDEYAVEQSLRIVEATGGGSVTYLTMGAKEAEEALRRALSMGGDDAVHVVDEALHGSDALATSLVLARALDKLEWDLVITGMASTDAAMGVVPAMISERLGVPALTLASKLTVESDRVTILRDVDDTTATVTASLPCLVSVTDQTGEARYPSFKGIMAAKKKAVTAWSLQDLQLDGAQVGLAGAWSAVDAATRRPSRTAGVVVTDVGAGGVLLADFLTENKFI